MEEKKPNQEKNKVKVKVSVKTIIIISAILVVLLASNVFAGIMGYGNIFFIIKNLVSTGSVSKKEITVEGENEIKKISEVELKKYLGYFVVLNYMEDYKNDMLIEIAQRILNDNGVLDIQANGRELVNEVVDSFYGNLAKKIETKNSKGEKVEVLKLDGDQYIYDSKEDCYRQLTDGVDIPQGVCLKINDINFDNGKYTAEFIYILPRIYDYDENNLENLEQYKAKITFTYNENSKCSKFQIVELSEGVEIK